MNLRLLRLVVSALIVGTLAACSTRPPAPVTPSVPSVQPPAAPTVPVPVPGTLTQSKSRWVPVGWGELPGFEGDALHEAWNAWLRSCERPAPAFAPLCGDVRRLSIASPVEQRGWMMQRLQPYQVQAHSGQADGLLTSYYEPVMQASRVATASHRVPLYAVPAGGAPKSPWFTRQQIDTLPAAQAALRGREIVWMADPIDAMVLHVQGSGRMQVRERDGRLRDVRLAFAGTNNQTFRSPSAWISSQGGRGGSWDNVRAWAAQNPGRTQAMLWSNPRYVFFREEAIQDANAGPRGAQGVPLTPGRSIAVDRDSIPYGTPVWLSTSGPTATLNRMVLAQDTGNAIRGAVRADYFAGWSPEAATLAHAMKQPLRLWVLWPR